MEGSIADSLALDGVDRVLATASGRTVVRPDVISIEGSVSITHLIRDPDSGIVGGFAEASALSRFNIGEVTPFKLTVDLNIGQGLSLDPFVRSGNQWCALLSESGSNINLISLP